MAPFRHYADDLRERFGVESEEETSNCLKSKIRKIKDFDGDVIIITTENPCRSDEVLDFFIEADRVRGKSCQAKLVFFDYTDGNESMFWEILPYCDLFLKQYLHRDLKKYRETFHGGSELIHYFVESGEVGNSIEEEVWTNLFQSQLDEKYLHKVKLGWNFGLWLRLMRVAEGKVSSTLWVKDKLHKRLATLAGRLADQASVKRGGPEKPIDVYCRATLYKGWTKQHRIKAMRLLNEIEGDYNIVSSQNNVGFSEYYREMENSKIFVSPSGWCEYTPKDYEAMIFRTLLIKPDCEHIDTEPNVLIPNETYVPVAWDFSDLQEKVVELLENPNELNRIATNGQEAILSYYREKKFLDKFEEILTDLDLKKT